MRPLARRIRNNWLPAVLDYFVVRHNHSTTTIRRTLWSCLILLLIVGCFHILFLPRSIPQLIPFIALLALVISCFYLFYRSNLNLVLWVLLGGGWLLVTAIVMFSGGIYSPHVLGYITLTLGMAVLIGPRAGIGAMIVNTFTILGIFLLQCTGNLPEQYLIYWAVNAVVVGVLWITLSLVLVELGIRQILKSKKRSFATSQANAHGI